MSHDVVTASDEADASPRAVAPPAASADPRPVARPGRSRDPGSSRGGRIWAFTWPKVVAVLLAVAFWQAVYLSGWKPEYLLPSPGATFGRLVEEASTARFWDAMQITLTRGVIGFTAALLVGSALGIAVSQWRVLRLGVGSMITGLQTMPSIAWFPLALLLFQQSEAAIFFVIVLGAAPSVANGIISGIDDTPPHLLRAGHMLGARGWRRWRHVVLPAALPSYLSGLKQGWAFSWRSLMAGELLVIIAERPSLGADLTNARQFLQADRLIALMIVILVIGMLIDAIFTTIANSVRRRRGLTGLTGAPG